MMTTHIPTNIKEDWLKLKKQTTYYYSSFYGTICWWSPKHAIHRKSDMQYLILCDHAILVIAN